MKKVLIACEYSATVRDAFRKHGFDAYSCDVLPTDGDPQYHYQGDVLEIINEGWDMMIAHPPCTYLSNVGSPHLVKKGVLNTERFEKGLQAKEFFLKLLNADIKHIAVENPVPNKLYDLPPYTQIIQPWQYGHHFSKKTCLWLKGLPNLEPTNIYKGTIWSYTEIVEKNNDHTRQSARAKFFSGIADAMAVQWGKYLL